ncbi:MOSC domain-containing protein [Sulfitobacter aestuariivivens]|uniref:MOSC domain-containing protein n=1 Tax=Sulfitobacter aestuariivivens TaxID=2766981 RepID=A0A927D635_9RHOB|nr:MOSC domain-containing protein [Sulfitobacter aestuariivivens]MBD3665895.1 MOSC domain-containing protein [Sulfitobacter aestuariivivens]
MIARFAQPGRLEGIWLRPERLERPVVARSAVVVDAGLEGDHGRAGKRAVTLIQAEHLPVIGAMLGQGAIDPAVLRRNLVVSGVNLSALKGRQVAVGGAVLEITGICAPCSRMEAALGAGGYSAMRGHGGWCASVVGSGEIAVGDAVLPV